MASNEEHVTDTATGAVVVGTPGATQTTAPATTGGVPAGPLPNCVDGDYIAQLTPVPGNWSAVTVDFGYSIHSCKPNGSNCDVSNWEVKLDVTQRTHFWNAEGN